MPARVVSALVLFALVCGVLALRLLAAPSGNGIRLALAPGPSGTAYLAAPGHGLLQLDVLGKSRRVGPLPTTSPRALATGSALILGADDGVFISYDGVRWAKAPIPGGHFLTVAAAGTRLAAASCAGGLAIGAVLDAGAGGRRALAGEVEAVGGDATEARAAGRGTRCLAIASHAGHARRASRTAAAAAVGV